MPINFFLNFTYLHHYDPSLLPILTPKIKKKHIVHPKVIFRILRKTAAMLFFYLHLLTLIILPSSPPSSPPHRENNPRFLEVLNMLESSPVCQSLAMHSFLMLPMQRITRLPLLVDAIFHRLEHNTPIWHEYKVALATLTKVTQWILFFLYLFSFLCRIIQK